MSAQWSGTEKVTAKSTKLSCDFRFHIGAFVCARTRIAAPQLASHLTDTRAEENRSERVAEALESVKDRGDIVDVEAEDVVARDVDDHEDCRDGYHQDDDCGGLHENYTRRCAARWA